MVVSHLRFLFDPLRAGTQQNGPGQPWPGGAWPRGGPAGPGAVGSGTWPVSSPAARLCCGGSTRAPWPVPPGTCVRTPHRRLVPHFTSSQLPRHAASGLQWRVSGRSLWLSPRDTDYWRFPGLLSLQPPSLRAWQGRGAACGASVFPCSSPAHATAWELGRRHPGSVGRAFRSASPRQGSLVSLLRLMPASSGQ